MIEIINADFKDIEDIKKLILEFHEESLAEYKLSFDGISMTQTLQTFINKHIVLVAKEDKKILGVIAGTIMPSIFDYSQKLGQEVVWYVTESARGGSAGIRLLKQFITECKNRGASFVAMVHMHNLYVDILKRFYLMNGFKPMEIQYIKNLN